MLPLNVPSSQRVPITDLARLDDPGFEAFLRVLERISAATSPVEMWHRVVTNGQGTSQQGAMILALINMAGVAERQQASVEELASAVTDDVREKKWLSEDKDIEQLRERLRRLIALPVITLTAKATNLTNESSHAFSSARIMTDVRPLFVSRGSHLATSAALIVHTLKLEIRNDDDQYTSMTAKELRELQTVISRAIRKEEKLREQLKPSAITIVDDDPLVAPRDSD